MATTIALQKHGFWEQFDPVPTEVIKVELVPYDEKWWRAFRTAPLNGSTRYVKGIFSDFSQIR